ncbi:diguanylate cyclase domain-containing protein [Ruminococcus flavefaciens]|uniref:diguanylate cyclase domain-containing protein n=1 Tax=Ruminococcus flavefaciens TaxID=1265 RepID=UPI000463CDA5|nr:diguanylate cyclase [Ruminococcus flavefaciens]
MNGSNKKISTVGLILIIQLVILIILSLGITKTISSNTRKDSIDHMQTITNERAHIIQTYVENAEKTLIYFSRAEDVSNILRFPDNSTYVSKAQAYTEKYSADIGNVEGLWIGTWDTHCIAHTNAGTVGIQTRQDPDKQKELQDALLKAGDDGVYNTGIIISPASGKQIVSMYKAVYDESGEPIGFVGLGIFTNELVQNLDNLDIKGIKESSYAMINVNDNKYIFNNDAKKIGTAATNKNILNICKELSSGSGSSEGSFQYKNDGKKYISIYSYMPKYNWILMIDDTKDEVYSLTRVMRSYMAIFAVAILALTLLFAYLNNKQEKANQKLASTIIKSNKTKESLYTAMFKDVLTDVSNRIAFPMDFEEVNSPPSRPYYFIMYNIANFSDINSRYGNDIGDWLLVRTVDVIKQVFKNCKIYRSGSDEFVIAMQVNETDRKNTDILEDAADVYKRLTSAQTTPAGKINFGFKASVARKSGQVNSSVITVLKDMINKDPQANFGHITYSDMDANENA